MHWEKSILVIAILFGLCYGHGYLSRPASRNNMRLVMNDKNTECPYGAGGCTVPDFDYDKQGRAAGGPGVVHANCHFGATDCAPQHGFCGDKFDEVQDHMEGGKYSSGLVNGIYAPGKVIYLDLIITAHHNGYHEFTLYDVPDDATAKTVTTSAVKSYPLKVYQPNMNNTMCGYWSGLDPSTKWCMPLPNGPTIRDPPYFYTSQWVLPEGVTCKRCVLQWHWVTANSPGANPEEFWGCADITIRSTGPYINDEQVSPVYIGAGYEPKANQPTAPPQQAVGNGKGCLGVPGKASDLWCQAAACSPEYVAKGYCRFADGSTLAPTATPTSTATTPPPSSATAKKCKSLSPAVPDSWCNDTVKCDAYYVSQGTCAMIN